jgi:acyl-CoA thioesterase FadM
MDDVVCVDARLTTVCVNTERMEPLPIPDEFRAKFEEIFEPDADPAA